jgi:hypothetical protein
VLARQLEVLDQNGESALGHGPITDEQNFVSEFQHGKVVSRGTLSKKFSRYKRLLKKWRTRRNLILCTPGEIFLDCPNGPLSVKNSKFACGVQNV